MKPGLGYEIDYGALHNAIDHVETSGGGSAAGSARQTVAEAPTMPQAASEFAQYPLRAHCRRSV